MIVDDGHQSSVDFKGHGLQRAFIIAVLNVWKDRLLLSQHAEARAAAKLVVIAIEEPELYLHPQQQRSLFQTLKEISNVKGHQVLVSSHSPFFIDMDNPLSTFCVSRDAGGEGTKVVQLDKHPFEGEGNAERKHRFQATQWLDPSRGEMFFAERVALIEGPTEKAVIPYVASRIGVYRPSVTIVDCGGKGNISLFVRILNAFKIPYVVIYDEDPIGDCSPAEKNYEHKVRMFRCNEEIKNLTIGNGEYRMMSPNFDDVVGVPKSQIEIKGKPLAVIDYIEQNGVPERVEELVRWIYTKVD
jgi:CRISPR-associated exonuclease Cas4